MPISRSLVREIRRLTPREKAALADHLWREAEGEMTPSPAQLAKLNRRAEHALRHPERTKPVKGLPPAKGTFGDLLKQSARPGWDKGVDWAKVDRSVSR